MKLATRIYGTDPELLVAKATLAEDLGYESVWRGDHVLLPQEPLEDYPHSADARPPFSPDAPILDTMTAFAFLAARTTRLKFATGIAILPLRHPVLVARAVQTLDVMAPGRMMLGVGTGWLREEFEYLGVPFRERGRRLTESIQVLRTLFRGGESTFAGDFYRYGPLRFGPCSEALSRLPIIAGGESRAALRRAIRLCDGWYGHTMTPEQAQDRLTSIREHLEEEGRSEDAFEITIRVDPAISPGDLERIAEIGVDRAVADIGSFEDERGEADLPQMERFMENARVAFGVR